MNEFSGSFDGEITTQTMAGINDVANHALGLAQVVGRQNSTDSAFDGARLAYWGVADLVDGSGPQHGYFVNTAENGDRNWGTFEGTVTTSGDQMTLDGVWRFTGGDGAYNGLVGNGAYRARALSPTVIRMEWDGEYKL